jgi:DNA invertase Pin-like site-specific DNA recombinase
VRLADPDAGPPSLMPRVRIGSALPDREALDVEIEQLRDLDVEQLRNRWHTVFDRRPPPQLSRHLLFRTLAYRLQADRWGDLDSERRRLLDRSGSPEQAGRSAVELSRRTSAIRPGTLLTRMQQVPVLADGFAWQDLPEPVAGRLRDHRHPLERTAVLRAPRPASEGGGAMTMKSVRCAIYTRVSTEQGLEQDFNSLDAQHEASQAYVRSQAHAGWTLLRAKYDDGGFSGGNTDRPALQRLLHDVRAGKIDVIVVYKVDRLTRSLADFAKLVDLFDEREVSFVSVTQQFNATTSIGRLTLNVLLSFAQFERELTSERIRDKIPPPSARGSGSAAWRRSAMTRKVARSPSIRQRQSGSGASSAAISSLAASTGSWLSSETRASSPSSDPEDRRDCRRNPVHTRVARPSAAQSLLCWRDFVQG